VAVLLITLQYHVMITLLTTHSADNFADAWVDQKISISDYSLSASVACGKFCCAMVCPGSGYGDGLDTDDV
jgi:rRNA pseudouridine-1189 N-methylase Emg1 (Nep1/Mra1 family)